MKNSLFATLFAWSVVALTPALTITLSVTPTTTIGQSDNTPAAVKAAITRLYPTAKRVKFEKEDGAYEAGFTHNGKSMSVVLDAKGTVKETETQIALSALPAAVRDYVAKHHADKKIREAAEIVDAEGKKIYEAEVGGKDLMFTVKGVPIN